MKLFVTMPEWNGQQYCDKGQGVLLLPINSPYTSYVGKINTDPLYDYALEQKVNNDEWKIISKDQSVTVIPSLQIPKINANTPDENPLRISWRIEVVDQANKLPKVQSDIFTVRISSAPVVKATITASADNNKLVDIRLQIVGGSVDKKYHWSSISKSYNIPESQASLKDLKNVPPGIYTLFINDSCGEIRYEIDTQNSELKFTN